MRNRAVEIAVDLEEVREAAAAQGVPLTEALARLKTGQLQGAAVLVPESVAR